MLLFGAKERRKGAFGCILEIVTSDQIAWSLIRVAVAAAPQDFTEGLRIAATREKFTSRGNADKKIHAAVVAGGSAIFIPGAYSTSVPPPPFIEGQQSDKLGHPLMNVPCSR